MPPVIVIGVDSPIGLTVVRELGEHDVPVHGIGKPWSIARASRYCVRYSSRPETAIADWLPALIERTGARAVFAVTEADLIALSALPETIGTCRILTPRAGPLQAVLDKSATLKQAAALGIDTPFSWQPVSGDDFAVHAAAFPYPAVAKWADPASVVAGLSHLGMGLTKAEFMHDAGDLLAVLDRYTPFGRWPLIQGYCPGTGLGQMIHMDHGEATMVFQHRRLHEWPPEGGVSTWCRAEPPDRHQPQMARSIALLRAIGWQGPAMVEYRFDPATGKYWLMEINGRFWGSLPLASHSRAHFAWEAYRRAILGDDSPAPRPRTGLTARYMIPETRRLFRILFARSAIADPLFVARPLRDLAAYIVGFFNPRMRYYVMRVRDPKPFLSDVWSVTRKAWSRGKTERD